MGKGTISWYCLGIYIRGFSQTDTQTTPSRRTVHVFSHRRVWFGEFSPGAARSSYIDKKNSAQHSSVYWRIPSPGGGLGVCVHCWGIGLTDFFKGGGGDWVCVLEEIKGIDKARGGGGVVGLVNFNCSSEQSES